ncbi:MULTISPECIES: DMT family transporter [Brevibacillus]|jgi:small multidrug resistance pump|uniref:DMT family transporter n=1 Tax=Brevibacillus TaxID=55080 RepID=UPI0005584B10|nr:MULTISPECIES: multidrug efflux SMR transporter [Brevibacillus]UYZ14131.1 multidrug efflux SMR transporter [Brevibacillus sp. WF146]
MSWLYLGLAICFEVAGTTFMKLSNGLSRPVFTVLMFVFYVISFSSLSMALKQLEVGTAYAIWSGVGTAAIAVIGFLFFKDVLTVQKIIAIVLIIVGCVMLNLSGDAHGGSASAGPESGVAVENEAR